MRLGDCRGRTGLQLKVQVCLSIRRSPPSPLLTSRNTMFKRAWININSLLMSF